MGISMEQVTAQDFQIIDNCLMIRLPEEIDHHGAGGIGRYPALAERSTACMPTGRFREF